MTVKYRIQLVEAERGWDRKYWQEVYDTYEEAKRRIRSVNEQNTSPFAPDWYIQAEDTIEAIEVAQ